MAQKALRIEIHPVTDLTVEQKRAFKRLKRYLGTFLHDQGKAIAADVAKAYSEATKLSDDAVERILKAASFDEWDVVADELAAEVGPTFEQTAEVILGKLQVDEQSIFDLVSERAVDYAEEAGADLVTSITETTRDRLRTMIANAVENAQGVQELRKEIEVSEAFSRDRAEMIARTEIGNAHMAGALEGAEQSGLELKKAVLRGSQEFDCDICGDNEDAGDLELSELFPSGDEAPLFHPNCECTLVFHLV